MKPLRIFISSVQQEFKEDRLELYRWLRNDPLMRRFFEPFLFEELPAIDRRADSVYLDEVSACDVYVGLFGNDYGYEDAKGMSPTELEYLEATAQHKIRLIFVKGADDQKRHPKMQALVARVGKELIRRRYHSIAELISSVYAALVHDLEDRKLIRNSPFDAAPCHKATLSDLDDENMAVFLRRARRGRGFPLPKEATSFELLTHLNLLDEDLPTHAAVLLFGRQPQRFLISSEIKCAHFHGVEVAKPIPSYQVYKGTVFALVDQAVDFVMSKINLWVGTRESGPEVPVEYEIPREVVAEAIVNAVAHRDYHSNGSVQVMLFADRLEIWNPGCLPPSLTLEKLRHPHGSVPRNPLLAEPLYLTKYIERMGTGTGDMIRRCREVGLPEPLFSVSDGFMTTIWRKTKSAAGQVTGQVSGQVTGQVDPWIQRILLACSVNELKSTEMQQVSGIKHRETFQRNYLDHLLREGLIERTIPDKPKSRLQKYRLSAKGLTLLESFSQDKNKG